MLGIMGKEQKKSKTPLQRAAQAFDLAQSVASMGNSLSGLYENAAKTAAESSGSVNEEMFDPKRYKLGAAEILPEHYSFFRMRKQ